MNEGFSAESKIGELHSRTTIKKFGVTTFAINPGKRLSITCQLAAGRFISPASSAQTPANFK